MADKEGAGNKLQVRGRVKKAHEKNKAHQQPAGVLNCSTGITDKDCLVSNMGRSAVNRTPFFWLPVPTSSSQERELYREAVLSRRSRAGGRISVLTGNG